MHQTNKTQWSVQTAVKGTPGNRRKSLMQLGQMARPSAKAFLVDIATGFLAKNAPGQGCLCLSNALTKKTPKIGPLPENTVRRDIVFIAVVILVAAILFGIE